MMTAEADARRIGALAEGLASGIVPTLSDDFAWRGKPCTGHDLAKKLAPMSTMGLGILETRIVPAANTAEIGQLLEEHSGVASREGDRLVIVTVQFGERIISWGLVIEAAGHLRAFFDPSALLKLIAP